MPTFHDHHDHAPDPLGPGHSGHPEGPGGDVPRGPTDLPRRSWWPVLRRTGLEFLEDELPDRAAALTYYGVLAVFPALLLLVSLIGLAGPSVTGRLIDDLAAPAPGPAQDVLRGAVVQLQEGRGSSGVLAAVGLLGALWSVSGYIGAFIRASNAVYDIREGRPVWKLTPIRLGLTVLLLVLLAASALIVVFTGPLARRAGDLLGLGDTALGVWSVAKWPVLVLLVVAMVALLYWAAPNVRGRGLRWVSPGSVLAVVLWLLLSGGFAAYVAGFGSYNRTYGAVAGAIVFLVWLWLTNLAILLGLEFDAELVRQRGIEGGMAATREPYLEPRDTRAWPDGAQP
ncbi:YihY/virulence factor BrkB family protein [Kitasatospora albolonga]|uniref:YihY/virulence factor BrkB family protein n=1 Tax=Kitasatospora albolonga TaxID=68173 RepID=UPI0035EA791F